MATGNIDELISVLESSVRQNSEVSGTRSDVAGSDAAAQPGPSAQNGLTAGPLGAAVSGSIGVSGGDLARLSSELEMLRRATTQQTESLLGNTQALMDSVIGKATGAVGGSGGSGGNLLTSAFGSMFGISPLISGVMSLFGLGKHDTPPPPLVDFALPQSIKQDVGVQADNSFTAPTYGDRGVAKGVPGVAAQPAAQINVQVQAMDSRSFLDRSDDIARAVKEAMLHSHSLNDVVVDL